MLTLWKTYKIGDIGDVVGGATPSTKNEDYYGGNIPWLTPKDLSAFSERYIGYGERNITAEGLNSCSARLLPKNSVLFTSRAPIGYIAIADNDIATNQGFKSIIPNEEVDYLFLYYLLKYNKEKIEAHSSGTTFKEVSGSVMKNIEVFMPSLKDEQRAIADILSCLDDKIELNNCINKTLEEIAQITFRQWFVEHENEWQKGTLSDIAYINPLRILSKNAMATYVEMSNLPTSGSFPMGWSKRKFKGGMKFRNGDTLLARITPCLENGKAAYVSFLNEDEVAFGSTEYIVLTAKEGYPNELLYFLARNEYFINYAVKNMTGSSGRQRVSADVIGNYEMLIPPKEFVGTYADLFAKTMAVIHNNSLQSRSLAAIRDALLPKLMSGEIRVPIVNRQ